MGEENGIDVTGLDIEKFEIVEQGTADGVALSLARGRGADRRRARAPGKVDEDQPSCGTDEQGAEAHYEKPVIVEMAGVRSPEGVISSRMRPGGRGGDVAVGDEGDLDVTDGRSAKTCGGCGHAPVSHVPPPSRALQRKDGERLPPRSRCAAQRRRR